MKRADLTRTLLHGSATAFFITALSQGVTFVVQAFLARCLGPNSFGIFSFAMAWLSVALVLGKLGYDTGLVRLVADYRARGDLDALAGVIQHGFRLTLGVGLAMAALAIAAVLLVSEIGEELKWTLLTTAVLVPIAIYSELNAAAVRGFRRVGVALAGDGLIRPLVLAFLVGTQVWFWPARTGAASTMVSYLAGTLASIALTRTVLSRLSSPATRHIPEAERRAWTRTTIPMMFASGFLTLLYAVDTLMLGWLDNTTSAGYYSVASKIALLVLSAMNAAQAIGAPMLSGAFATGDRQDMCKIINDLNKIAITLAVPLTVGVVFSASGILEFFGREFRAATTCLQLLAIMQAINVITGPVGIVLNMTSNQRALAWLLGVGVVVNVTLNLVLIPPYGATGAAVSALIAHTMWNTAGVLVIRRTLGLDCTIWPVLRVRRNALA